MWKIPKNKKTRVSITKPLTENVFTGDKFTGIKPDIFFCEVEDYDNPGSGDNAGIHVKTYKASRDIKQNTKNMTLLVIKYFDHQESKVVRVIHKITVSLFEHLGIKIWKVIYQS